MAFSLNDFKSNISQYKFDGLAPANKFHILLNAPSKVTPYVSAIASREIQFFCDTINLPGKNLNTYDHRPQGYGQVHKMPLSRAPENVTCTFYCDSKYQIMKYFQGWLDYIIEGTNATPSQTLTGGRQYREIAYQEDYITTLIARSFNYAGDSGGDIFGTGVPNPLSPGSGIEYKFYNCYPVQLGAVSVGWEQNDSILRVPIEFSYSHYESKILGGVNPRTLNPSGVGFIDSILQIGAIAGTLINTRRPRNVQDAINVVTNTSTVLRQLP